MLGDANVRPFALTKVLRGVVVSASFAAFFDSFSLLQPVRALFAISNHLGIPLHTLTSSNILKQHSLTGYHLCILPVTSPIRDLIHFGEDARRAVTLGCSSVHGVAHNRLRKPLPLVDFGLRSDHPNCSVLSSTTPANHRHSTAVLAFRQSSIKKRPTPYPTLYSPLDYIPRPPQV